MPRAGSGREPKLRPTCWRSFVRPTHVARVVGRHWRPRGKRPGRVSGGRPCVTRHGRHRTSPALHVTRKTRSRRLAVAPLHHGASRCTMEHHDATGVTTPRQTVKASPHRHKWMLSHGAPADPSDPWNSHAAPVSPRQNGQIVPAVTNVAAPPTLMPGIGRGGTDGGTLN